MGMFLLQGDDDEDYQEPKPMSSPTQPLAGDAAGRGSLTSLLRTPLTTEQV